MTPHPARQIGVLHHRHRPIAPDGAKQIASDEQPLVAVGQPEPPHAPAHSAFDDARLPPWRIDLEPIAAANRTVIGGTTDLVEPAVPEPGVSMQEQQPRPKLDMALAFRSTKGDKS